ncbi:MAG: flagellar biosynthesis protein FlhF [Thermoleophilaceae bacterium]|nr:flagellar biosynthesis protein FlhF [Thermoleophilaceae bacterium]
MSEMGGEVKVFRGRNLEEVLPQIRDEFGADAIITRQREGLQGGIAGFFQKQFVEVEARPGAPRVQTAPRRASLLDVYDDDDSIAPPPSLPQSEEDLATEDGLSSPAIQAMLEQAAPFADYLNAADRAQREAHEEVDPGAGVEAALESLARARGDAPEQRAEEPVELIRAESQESAPAKASAGLEQARSRRSRPAAADTLIETLTGSGLTQRLATALVDETVTHLLPFGFPSELKVLVRQELARRIPTQATWGGVGRRLGFVGTGGSGKTLSVARLAAAYAEGGDVPVVVLSLRPRDGGDELRDLLERFDVDVHVVDGPEPARARMRMAPDDAIVIMDTPAVRPHDDRAVAALADELKKMLYEIHLTLPATVSTASARELAADLTPLGISRICLTHLDETSHIGGAVEVAIRAGRPFSYVGTGAGVADGLEPADAEALAALLLP